MNIEFIERGNQKVAVLADHQDKINDAQDALELLMNSQYLGADKIIISEENLLPDFFDLKTGIAGDILQKFSTYDGYLAIVGDYSKFTSKSLRDFIYESNKHRRINFVATQEEALQVLTG